MRATLRRRCLSDFAHRSLNEAWSQSFIADTARTSLTTRPVAGEVSRRPTRPSALHAPTQRVHVRSSPTAWRIPRAARSAAVLLLLDERLAHPGADPLACDHLRQGERRRAGDGQVARRKRLAGARLLAGSDHHAREQRREHRVQRHVVLGLGWRVGALTRSRPGAWVRQLASSIRVNRPNPRANVARAPARARTGRRGARRARAPRCASKRRSSGSRRALDLVPGDRRRHGGPLACTQRVHADGRLEVHVLAPVDKDLALPQLLALLGDDEVRVLLLEQLRHRARERRGLVVGHGGVKRQVHLHALRTGRLGKAARARAARTCRAGAARRGSTRRSSPAGRGRGRTRPSSGRSYAVAVPSDVCSSSAARFASQMSVGRSLARQKSMSRGPRPSPPQRPVPRVKMRATWHPVRAVVGAVLLVEELLVDAVRVADARQRPVVQVAEHDRRDPRVVVDHVPLREPRGGVHDLVEVRELEAAAPGRLLPCPMTLEGGEAPRSRWPEASFSIKGRTWMSVALYPARPCEGQRPQGDGRGRAARRARAGGGRRA